MKHLIEITRIITRKKIKKIEIFDDNAYKLKNNKFGDFYEAIMTGKYRNDREAALNLYNCTPTDDRYRQLKSRFKKRLLNTLFFLDVNQPDTTNYNRAYYACNREWTLVKILLAHQATSTATDMALQILAVAEKFKFADIIVNCSRILRQFAMETENDKLFEVYDRYCKQYQDVLAAEIRSEELYQRVVINYHKPMSKNDNLAEKIDTFCEALVGLSEIYDSPVINYNTYMVWAYRYEMLDDYDSVLEICDKAEQYVADNPIYHRDDLVSSFFIKRMSAYLHKQDFMTGKISAEKCLSALVEGEDAWFEFLMYYFLLAFHTENYVNAVAIYEAASANPRFKRLPSEQRELWSMFEHYVAFVTETAGESNPILQEKKLKGFRLNKFLAEPLTHYSREHKHHVFLLSAVQLLFHLHRNNFTAATNVIDRMRLYANRQAKTSETFRYFQFAKLLQQLAKADYQIHELSNTDRYYVRLIEQPLKYRGLIEQMEIIPYEKLWQMILQFVRK